MAKLAIKKASTDVTVYLFIQDSSKTTGEGLTGLAYNTGSLVGYYVRPKGSATAITLATQTVTGDHSDGGFKEVDATNMPGVYRLDLPDAVCATGVPSVVVMLKGATNMSPVVLEIQLTDFDLNTAAITVDGIADAVWDEAISGHTTGTTFGGKNQKVVPSETINDYKADVSALTNVTLAATQTGVTIPTVTTVGTTTNLTNLPTMPTDWLTAAGLKADAVTEIQSGLATAAALDAVDNFIDTEVAAILAAVDTEVAAIKAKTDNLPASPAAVGSAMTLTAAYDKAKDDVLTPLAVVDSIVDGLKTTLDNIHDTDLPAVKTETAAILADTGTDGVVLKAAGLNADAVTEIQSGMALEATLTAIKGAGWTGSYPLETIGEMVSSIETTLHSDGDISDAIAAILADTNELQTDLVNGGRLDLLIDSIITHLTAIKGAGWTNQTLVKIVTDIAAISAGSGATAQEVWEYATRVLTAGTNIDLSALATATDLATVDTVVDAIKAKTDNLPASPAAVGSAMTLTPAYDKAKDDVLTPLAVVDNIVDGLKTTLDNIHDTDLPAVKTETAAIKAKTDLIPASPAEAGEYTAAIAAVKSVADDILVDTGTTLDALIKDIPTNAELATALGTADDAVLAAVAAAKVVIDDIHDTDLPAVKAETALIVEDTGTTLPAVLEVIDNFIDTEVAAILEDTGTTIPATLATIAGYTDGIAGDVWSHATRTLTVPAVAMSDPEDGTTLTLYKDADINIEFTGLTIPTGAKKVVFTIKDNLDDADTAAALQATYQLTAVPAETHTLNYINSATPPTLTNPVTFTVTTDSVEFDMTAAAAYYLPRYERGYLKWDLKLITATTVQILQQGLVQILGTSTRTVA